MIEYVRKTHSQNPNPHNRAVLKFLIQLNKDQWETIKPVEKTYANKRTEF